MPRLRALRTADLRQSRRGKRLERHHVRVAPRAPVNSTALQERPYCGQGNSEPAGNRRADRLVAVRSRNRCSPRATEARVATQTRTTASCSGQGTPSVDDEAWYPPDIRDLGREPHAPACITDTRDARRLRSLARTRTAFKLCARQIRTAVRSAPRRGTARRGAARRGATDDPRPGRASAPTCRRGVRLGGPRPLGASPTPNQHSASTPHPQDRHRQAARRARPRSTERPDIRDHLARRQERLPALRIAKDPAIEKPGHALAGKPRKSRDACLGVPQAPSCSHSCRGTSRRSSQSPAPRGQRTPYPAGRASPRRRS
jgi:hypothetical protein